MSHEASSSGKNKSSQHHKEQTLRTQSENSETAERKEVAASGNIVEGLLEIVNMITDNPGLKNDLQEYFQETRRSGTSKRRRQTRQSSKKGSKSKTKRVENEKLSDLIRDYKELVVEQQSADTNSTSEDIDGEALPVIEELQGFKKTFTTVDSYQELPMDLDSGDEELTDTQDFPYPSDRPRDPRLNKIPPPERDESPPKGSIPTAESSLPKDQVFGETRDTDVPPRPPNNWDFPAQMYNQTYRPRAQPGPPRYPPPHIFRHPPPPQLPPPSQLPRPFSAFPAFPPRDPFNPPFTQQVSYHNQPFTNHFTPDNLMLPEPPPPVDHFDMYPLQQYPPLPPPPQTPEPVPPPPQEDAVSPLVQDTSASLVKDTAPSPKTKSTPHSAETQHNMSTKYLEEKQKITPDSMFDKLSVLPNSNSPVRKLSDTPRQLFFVSSDSSDNESYAEDSVPSEDSFSPDLDTLQDEDLLSKQTKKHKQVDPENYQVDEIANEDQPIEREYLEATDDYQEDEIPNDQAEESVGKEEESHTSDVPPDDESSEDSSSESSDESDSDSSTSHSGNELEITPTKEKKTSDDEDDINNKYNLDDIEDEQENLESSQKLEEDEAAALRSLLLDSIKTNKVGVKCDVVNSPDQSNLSAAVSTEDEKVELEDVKEENTPSEIKQMKSEIHLPNENDEVEPLVRRNSKRKKCGPSFALNDVLDIVRVLPEISEVSFRAFYKTKRQQKRARVRARQARVEPLEILKQELYYDPEINEWLIHNDVNSKLPAQMFSYSRLSKFLAPCSNHTALPDNKKDKNLEEKQLLRKKRLQTFFQLSERVQSTEKPAVPEKTISPKEIKITIKQEVEPPDVEMDAQITTNDLKFKSTFKETATTKPASIPDKVEPPVVKNKRIKKIIVKGSKSSKRHTNETIQNETEPKEPDSGEEQNDAEAQNLRSERRRTTSEDDLDSMRELLLQSMIKKAAKEPDNLGPLTNKSDELPPLAEKKSYLPLVKLKTRDNSSNNSTPRPSPPRGEAGSEQKMPQQPQLTTDTGSTLPGTRSLNSDSSVSSPKQTLVELSGAIKPPVKLGDCLESLMPRSLDTLNPEAIKKSNENTRKMISRLLVDVDLRLPQKDTMLSLEAKTEKEKLLKRITPKVKPMIITFTNTDSESESDVTPTTPVKHKTTPVSAHSGPEDMLTVKLNTERSNLSYKMAQLQQRLIQYTLKRNQQQEEHVRHADKVRSLTVQHARAQEIVRKSSEIMKSLDQRRGSCLTELKVKGVKLQDLLLRINNPELWKENERLKKLQEESTTVPPVPASTPLVAPSTEQTLCGVPSTETTECPVTAHDTNEKHAKSTGKPQPSPADASTSDAVTSNSTSSEMEAVRTADTKNEAFNENIQKSGVNEVASSATTVPSPISSKVDEKGDSSSDELEPGELGSDSSSKHEGDSEEEVKDEEEEAASQDEESSSTEDEETSNTVDGVFSSSEMLLKYCKPFLALKPLPRLESHVKSNIEFKRVTRQGEPDSVLQPAIKFSPYKSPLSVFRSYRFSPYYRIKSQYNLTSTTFSHNIRPEIPICPHDLHGKCFDKSCNKQHLSLAIRASGPQLRTHLCISAGVSMSEVKHFEATHKNLSEEDMNILFCAHLNSLRVERAREYYYINTKHTPPSFYSSYNSSDNSKLKDKLDHYNSPDSAANQPTKYDKVTVTRYCASMSETSLTEQCKADPKLVGSWLDLAQCQATRGADAGVVVGTLSKALQANKHSPELWSEYLRVKSAVVPVSTLTGLYNQALKLAPSPRLWRNLAPNLITLSERLAALASALKMCDLTKEADRECYGELLKDKLSLIHYSGDSTDQQFHDIFENIANLTDSHTVWFVQQYLSMQQSGSILDNPSLVIVLDNLSVSQIPGIVEIISRGIECVSGVECLLTLHRLCAVLLARKSGAEEAINYLSEVTERRPDLFELMEDIIELGGWVEPDVPWPKLTFLQMQTAIEKDHPDMALSFSRELVRILSGVSSENTLQLYREVLGVTIGARVMPEYSTLSRGLHRTWLYLCYGLVASLSAPDPVLQYKLYSTRLATVFPSSEQLNALRHGIAVEPTTRGAQILWERYLHVLEEETGKDPLLVDVFESEMSYCLKSVPTLSADDFSFHNQVLTKLLSHCATLDDKFREASAFLLSYRKNKHFLIRYSDILTLCNPLSTVQLIKELLKDNPTCPILWSKLLGVSERCHSILETRHLVREAITTLPLNSSLLLQAVMFELRNMKEYGEQHEFCEWALQRAGDKGIVLKPISNLLL